MLGSFCVESSDPSHTCDIGVVQINERLYIGVTSLPGLVAFLKQDFGMSVDNILSYSICRYPFKIHEEYRGSVVHYITKCPLTGTSRPAITLKEATVEIDDCRTDACKLVEELPLMTNRIEKWIRSREKGSVNLVLINCGAGVSRGPAIAIPYIAWKTGLSWENAFSTLLSVRQMIEPRVNFPRMVMIMDEIKKVSSTVTQAIVTFLQSVSRSQKKSM